ETLSAQPWQATPAANHALLDEVLHGLALDDATLDGLPRAELLANMPLLESICAQPCFSQMRKAILDIVSESEWMNNAREALRPGSPLSSVLTYEQLIRYRYADLRTVFLSEYILSVNILRYREFPEGIRALLIDKDKNPQWTFTRFDHVPTDLMNRFFTAPWEQNPLAELMEGDAR